MPQPLTPDFQVRLAIILNFDSLQQPQPYKAKNSALLIWLKSE